MNKPLRYFLFFFLFLPSQNLTASNFFSFAGMCTARTLADISLLPVAFGGRPIGPLAQLLHNKLGTELTSPNPTKTTSSDGGQTIGSENSDEKLDSQTINLGNLPQVIHATVANIKKDSAAPVYLNLNLNNQQVSSNASTKKIGEPATIQSTSRETPQDQSSHTHFKTHFLQSIQSMGSWIKNNKFRSLFISMSGFIGSIQALLWYFGRILTQPDCWSSWQGHSSLPSLYQMNQKELIRELLKHLQQKDLFASQPLLLQRFITESEKELQTLSRFVTLSRIAQKWPFKYLLFRNTELLETIPSRIARLSFLKNIVLGYLRENNLTAPNFTHPQEQQS